LNKRSHKLTSLAVAASLLWATLPWTVVQAAALPPAIQQTEPASDILTPEALGNIVYKTEMVPDGAQLTDGKYEDTANSTIVVLAPKPIAYGTLNGQDAAAVVIAENGGGSGTFVYLAVVVDQDGTPVNVATTLLGDRVYVTSLAIADDQITLEAVAQGPNDPMCCPSQIVTQTYTLDGDTLTVVDESIIGTVPQISIANAPNGYTTTFIPATPYDASNPPGPVGAPLHTVVAFGEDDPTTVMQDGKPYIAVYPAAAYASLWTDAGDTTIGNTITNLTVLLAARPDAPTPPMPILPPPGAVNDLATHVEFIDANGFSGVRFVGRVAQDASPILNDQLNYYFQGLSTDGQFVVVAQSPITTTVLPATVKDLPADTAKSATDDFATYSAAMATQLNGLADADWSPALSTLDATIASMTLTYDATLTPAVLGNLEYTGLQLAVDGKAQLTDGQFEDTTNRVLVGIGANPTAAFGAIDGQQAAVVIVGESGVGSAGFENLALVIDQDGTPTNVATTLLGDRVGVKNLAITADGVIIVDMVAQGPDDPMCCPTMPTTQAYALVDGQLALMAQVAATIAAKAVTEQVLATIIQPTPYDSTMPPGPQGQPKHPVWSLDLSNPSTVMDERGAYVAIYSVPAYKQMWNAAGDNLAADTIGQLEALLKAKPANPESPMPILPEQPGTNDIAAQVAYLDLPGGGAGVRWLGRISQAVMPVEANSLRYYFQGLSADSQRLIVAQIPVTIPVVAGVYAGDVSADEMAKIEGDYAGYIAGVTTALNDAAGSDFAPDLAVLDQTIQSIVVTESTGAPASEAATPAATEAITSSATTTATAPASSTGDLSGTQWVWTETLMSDGTKITPMLADAFKLTFNPDGTANAATDCNAFSGTYVVGNDSKLTIDLPISTRKGCPDGAQEGAYIKALTSIQSYLTQDGNLYLMLPFDSGTINYAPLP